MVVDGKKSGKKTNRIHYEQLKLFEIELDINDKIPPSTRYQGSKLKLLPWIWENISGLSFHTALDIFGGTGSVSYMLKKNGKAVTYNDYLKFNHLIGIALIENKEVRLDKFDIDFILRSIQNFKYDNFIERTFKDVYYTDEENRWLDFVCQNIYKISCKYKQALAYYALFQSCIIKRPYNLFHRKNLYMREASIKRSFGNKSTWDTSFETHFRSFVLEANEAVFDSEVNCNAVCHDALEVPGEYDLVYMDSPYINAKGVGVDYLDFYHFLEGMIDYYQWGDKINYKKKHLPLTGKKSDWSESRHVLKAFKKLFERFKNSIIVVSYRSDGIPSEKELVSALGEVKNDVRLISYGEYKYALSTNGKSHEILIIGK